MAKQKTIYTVGHSTLPIEHFISMLTSNGIEALVDVRRFAGSRRHPHFNPRPLATNLNRGGISYLPMPALGARRKPDPASNLNNAWNNASFRGYADYMQTPAFRKALA